jgi:hypothetical protein
MILVADVIVKISNCTRGGKALASFLEPHAKQVYTGRKGEAPCIQYGVHETWKLDRQGDYISQFGLIFLVPVSRRPFGS